MAVIKKSSHKNATRSRHLIKQAFGELLNEKPLARITVTDIVERANISRGTFYAHYLDVFDLFTAIQNNIIETLELGFEKLGIENIIADPTEAVRMGMSFLAGNKSYYALFMTSPHSESLIERTMQRVEERVEPLIEEHMSPERVPLAHCFLTYTLGAYRDVLVKWFSGELNLSGEECANYLIDFYLRSRPQEVIELSARLKTASRTVIG